ncbi:hypothetical protein Tco_0766699, partial [Tanacetum coccineum]
SNDGDDKRGLLRDGPECGGKGGGEDNGGNDNGNGGGDGDGDATTHQAIAT